MKWDFLALKLKNFLYFLIFQDTKIPPKFFIFHETETLKSFLYFRKCNFLSPSPKNKKNPLRKKFLIFQEMPYFFLYFQKWNPTIFSPSSKNKKKSTPRKFLVLQETETSKKSLYFRKGIFRTLAY